MELQAWTTQSIYRTHVFEKGLGRRETTIADASAIGLSNREGVGGLTDECHETKVLVTRCQSIKQKACSPPAGQSWCLAHAARHQPR